MSFCRLRPARQALGIPFPDQVAARAANYKATHHKDAGRQLRLWTIEALRMFKRSHLQECQFPARVAAQGPT